MTHTKDQKDNSWQRHQQFVKNEQLTWNEAAIEMNRLLSQRPNLNDARSWSLVVRCEAYELLLATPESLLTQQLIRSLIEEAEQMSMATSGGHNEQKLDNLEQQIRSARAYDALRRLLQFVSTLDSSMGTQLARDAKPVDRDLRTCVEYLVYRHVSAIDSILTRYGPRKDEQQLTSEKEQKSTTINHNHLGTIDVARLEQQSNEMMSKIVDIEQRKFKLIGDRSDWLELLDQLRRISCPTTNDQESQLTSLTEKQIGTDIECPPLSSRVINQFMSDTNRVHQLTSYARQVAQAEQLYQQLAQVQLSTGNWDSVTQVAQELVDLFDSIEGNDALPDEIIDAVDQLRPELNVDNQQIDDNSNNQIDDKLSESNNYLENDSPTNDEKFESDEDQSEIDQNQNKIEMSQENQNQQPIVVVPEVNSHILNDERAQHAFAYATSGVVNLHPTNRDQRGSMNNNRVEIRDHSTPDSTIDKNDIQMLEMLIDGVKDVDLNEARTRLARLFRQYSTQVRQFNSMHSSQRQAARQRGEQLRRTKTLLGQAARILQN